MVFFLCCHDAFWIFLWVCGYVCHRTDQNSSFLSYIVPNIVIFVVFVCNAKGRSENILFKEGSNQVLFLIPQVGSDNWFASNKQVWNLYEGLILCPFSIHILLFPKVQFSVTFFYLLLPLFSEQMQKGALRESTSFQERQMRGITGFRSKHSCNLHLGLFSTASHTPVRHAFLFRRPLHEFISKTY